ncbi:hypothetical protein EKN06_03560 [Croceicoccus ponticola]|uniref:Uncharacterized protein n=1 Tax=Croceicoccus ponticola TaxID=2217664 RepID=A0A437H0X3_9SPHN|nr:hypothetical protein [Croceicoccus ponticola]RVQ69281.1 hypothetical protein EKN06_03560 [Croceicoccus ponticola]
MISKTVRATSMAAAIAIAFAMGQPAIAQDSLDDLPVLTEYHFAPGKYAAAMAMMADGDRIRAEAGLEPITYYWHVQGDSWQVITVSPPTVENEGARYKAAREKLKIARPDPGAGMTLMTSHIDTLVRKKSAAEMQVEMQAAASD